MHIQIIICNALYQNTILLCFLHTVDIEVMEIFFQIIFSVLSKFWTKNGRSKKFEYSLLHKNINLLYQVTWSVSWRNFQHLQRSNKELFLTFYTKDIIYSHNLWFWSQRVKTRLNKIEKRFAKNATCIQNKIFFSLFPFQIDFISYLSL